MALLAGLRVAEIGCAPAEPDDLAVSVCGRLFVEMGASVTRIGATSQTPLACWLDAGKTRAANSDVRQTAIAAADLIVCAGGPRLRAANASDDASLRRINAAAAIIAVAPFGQVGVNADDAASDLTLFAASGIARMLTGQVDDLAEAPVRAVGEQSAFIGGIAAACAGMQAVLLPRTGAWVDVSMQEALATLAITELARAGLSGRAWSRERRGDGNGATVTILPASDGHVAVSPREERQWQAWLGVMGNPPWGGEARFAKKADRAANFADLHALMATWSRNHDKQWIADAAQAAHVPSFPLRQPADHFGSQQLAERGFFQPFSLSGQPVRVPGSPFGLTMRPGRARPAVAPPSVSATLPLSGIRVLDFSWVIAGPTATRYLAALGADVIKVEAPGAGDPGRASELHAVLGQGKRSIVIDLKSPDGVELARGLAAHCDVLVENFAGGVMDRLGLGASALRDVNERLIYVSASGLGRTGPEAGAVAYGTLLQCYSGFAALNGHPDRSPRVGMAWLDPMCGLLLAFVVAAALWQRARSGIVTRVDLSMIEAMLWTLAEPLLAAQSSPGTTPRPRGNQSDTLCPHGVFRCAGDDAWVAIVVKDDAAWAHLCDCVPSLETMSSHDVGRRRNDRARIDAALAAWTGTQLAADVVALLQHRDIAACALADSLDLVASSHLRTRGFWHDAVASSATNGRVGVLPGLPWRASFDGPCGTAPAHGEHTDALLADVLGLSADAVDALRRRGVVG